MGIFAANLGAHYVWWWPTGWMGIPTGITASRTGRDCRAAATWRRHGRPGELTRLAFERRDHDLSALAVGISNRVVLLDNDTAPRDTLRALRGATSPSHYSILHYPDIDLAPSYPTLGPCGLSEMDVNGLAGSIELYLGIDVLTGPDGKPTPVHWRSHS